jgi:hypothetical protein
MAAPFGASAAGVRALVLDAAANDGVTRIGTARPPRVSDTQIEQWLEEGGTRILFQITGYESLPPVLLDQVETLARGLLHSYAASFLADATHPEKAGGAGRLGDSYWQRYQTGLTELAAFVQLEIEKLRLVESPEVGATDFGAGHSFPPLRDSSAWMQRGF